MECDETYSLPELVCLKLQFDLSAEENGCLAQFKGSLLHGILGNSLRRIICTMPRQQPCESCLLKGPCIYTQIFESFVPPDPPRFLKNITTSPKPFVLNAPDKQQEYKTGDTLTFNITLFGKACEFYAFIIYAVKRMAEHGLGSRRSRFKLGKVYIKHGLSGEPLLYDGANGELLMQAKPMLLRGELPEHEVSKLRIIFNTPTRLKFNNHLGMTFSFRGLAFRMLRRILELVWLYSPEQHINWEFHNYLLKADDISITYKKLEWIEVHRYSSRQKADMQFDGFTGEILLEGHLTPFWPLLKMVEDTHVGKATSFGNGKISVIQSI